MKYTIARILACGLLGASCVHRAELPKPSQPLSSTGRAALAHAPALRQSESLETPPVSIFRLGNGLSVLVLEQPHLDWVSIRYTMRRGAEDGSYMAVGAASMVLKLTMQAAEDRTAPGTRTAAQAEDSAYALRGYVDRVAGHLVTSSALDELDTTLGELAALVRKPRISIEAVRDVAHRQMDRMDEAYYDAIELARCHAYQIMYGANHPLGQPIDGRMSEIGKLTIQQLEAFHHFMFAPEASALIVVGGARAAQVRELAERHFSALVPSPSASRRRAWLGESPKRRVRGLLTPGQEAYVVQAFPAPGAPSSDRVPFRVLSMLAAELFGSRLNQALRERAAQTYHVGARYDLRANGGNWLLEVQVDPEDLVDTLRTIDDELARLADGPIAFDELERARTQFRERRRAQLADAADAAQLLDDAFALAVGVTPEDVRAEWQRDDTRIEGIDAGDLAELAQRYLDSKQRALVVAGNVGAFGDALEAWSESIDIFVPKQFVERRPRRRFVVDE